MKEVCEKKNVILYLPLAHLYVLIFVVVIIIIIATTINCREIVWTIFLYLLNLYIMYYYE